MRIVPIDEPDDPRLSDYRDLTDGELRRRRDAAEGLYMAETLPVIERAVAAGHSARSALVHQRRADAVAAVLADQDVPVYVVPDAVAEQVTGFAMHRGALAAMNRPALPSVAEVLEGARTVLVLEDITDHANVGAAFRAAAGLGADAVLIAPRCADPLYRRSLRVSMGTVNQIPWTRTGDWRSTADLLHADGFCIAALALSDDAVGLDAFAAASEQRIALIMGSEGDGLSDAALAVADRVVTIPMSRGVDSLNVASAAAVALWAVTR